MIFAEILYFVNIKIQLYLRVQKNHRYKNQNKSNGVEKDSPDGPYLHITPLPKDKNILLCSGQNAIMYNFYKAFTSHKLQNNHQ